MHLLRHWKCRFVLQRVMRACGWKCRKSEGESSVSQPGLAGPDARGSAALLLEMRLPGRQERACDAAGSGRCRRRNQRRCHRALTQSLPLPGAQIRLQFLPLVRRVCRSHPGRACPAGPPRCSRTQGRPAFPDSGGKKDGSFPFRAQICQSKSPPPPVPLLSRSCSRGRLRPRSPGFTFAVAPE